MLTTTKKKFLIPAIVFAICLFTYINSFSNQFLLDDFVVLFGEKGVSNTSFFSLFTSYQYIFYRPIGHFILKLSYLMFGEYAPAYHGINFLLFYAICVLFFYITQELTDNESVSFLTAALFAAHPINGMLVNYITASVISTFVLSMQVSFLLFIRYLKEEKRPLLIGSLLAFGVSLLSHEMSMMMPAYILCYLYFMADIEKKKSIRLAVFYIGLTLVYFVFRMYFFSLSHVMGRTAAVASFFQEYLISLFRLVFWYLSKLVFPKDIIFLWVVNLEGAYSSAVELAKIALLAGVVIYCLLRWKKGLKAFALAIFLVGFFPLTLASYAHFPFSEPIIEPHWFYFSSLGFFILLAELLSFLNNKIKPFIGNMLLGILFGLLLFLSWQHNAQWKTPLTYSQYWLSINDRNLTPYYGIGKALLKQGDYVGAIQHFEKGMLKAQHYNSFVAADLGYAYFKIGQEDTALEYYKNALSFDSTYSVTYYYLGHFYLHKQDFQQAFTFFEKAYKLYPKNENYFRHMVETRARFSYDN